MDHLGQTVELSAICQRQPHQIGNDKARHFTGNILDEFALSFVNHGIHNLCSEFLNSMLVLIDRALGKFAADELSIGCVLWRVHHQHHLVLAHRAGCLWVGICNHDGW